MATIQKQGRGYKITVSQGRDYTGKKIRKYMTWVPEPGMTERQIKKELERQAVLFEENVSSGATANGSMRFADFAEKYMTEYAALYLKPKTIATYTENLSRINQANGIALFLYPEGFDDFKKIMEGVINCDIHTAALKHLKSANSSTKCAIWME